MPELAPPVRSEYRLLRWRAATAAQPGHAGAAAIPGASPWLRNMLG